MADQEPVTPQTDEETEMKSVVGLSVCALSLLAFATSAYSDGPASNGDFQFALDGAAGAIQFDARTETEGTSRGQVLFMVEVDVSNEDVDGDGSGGAPFSSATFAVEFDCLAIDGNRAAMSGKVVSSTVDSFLDRQAVLVVEDNEEGRKAGAPDGFTWGVYPSTVMGWTPSDAELEKDPGVGMVWHATDAERADDVGMTVSFSHPSPPVDCTSFPFSAYALAEIWHGGGNVQVKP